MLKQKKELVGFSSIMPCDASPEPCLTAIKEFVPGDSGGITTSSAHIRGGIAGARGDILERDCNSICIIWLKFGLVFGSSLQHDVTIKAKSSGRFSALGLMF